MTHKKCIGLLFCVILACTDWDLQRVGFTRVITIGAIEVGSNSAFLIGDIENIRMSSIVETGFVLSQNANDDESLRLGLQGVTSQRSPGLDTISEDRAFAARVSGLNGSTTYHFRAYVKIEDEQDVAYGSIEVLMTKSLSISIESVLKASESCATQAFFDIRVEGIAPGGMTEVNLVYSTDIDHIFPSLQQGISVSGGIPGVDGFLRIPLNIICESRYFVRAYIAETGQETLYSDLFAFSTKSQGEWIMRAPFDGMDRSQPYGFAIDGLVYLGGGRNRQFMSDYFQYDLGSDIWAYLGEEDSLALYAMSSNAIGGKGIVCNGSIDFAHCGYIVCGCQQEQLCRQVRELPCVVVFECPSTSPKTPALVPCECENDRVFIFEPVLGTWVGVSDFPARTRKYPVTFRIADKIYTGLGYKELVQLEFSCDGCVDGVTLQGLTPVRSTYFLDLWSYDGSTGQWNQEEGFPGEGRIEAFSFTIGKQAYIGSGYAFRWVQQIGAYSRFFTDFTDLYAFDPSLVSGNLWNRKADFPGEGRKKIAFGSISNGYVLLQSDGLDQLQFWKYDPDSDGAGVWNQIPISPMLNGRPELAVSAYNMAVVYFSGADDNFWMYVPEI